MHSLETDQCLLIFDPHQDITWMQRVLEKETAWTHLLLGGDYFDAKSPTAANLGDTCDFLVELWERHADRMTILLGNHDIQYIEGRRFVKNHQSPHDLAYRIPSCYTNSRAKMINKSLPDDMVNAFRLFQRINGWFVSHAGLAPTFWDDYAEMGDPLAEFDARCQKLLINLGRRYDSLLDAGRCRGGLNPVGGITWQDWRMEFTDSLPWPQIVGHTSSLNEAKQDGRSWCLDGRQSCYGLLSRDGAFSVQFA